MKEFATCSAIALFCLVPGVALSFTARLLRVPWRVANAMIPLTGIGSLVTLAVEVTFQPPRIVFWLLGGVTGLFAASTAFWLFEKKEPAP